MKPIVADLNVVLQALAEEFAEKCPVGTRVRYYPILPCPSNAYIDTTVISEPRIAHGKVLVELQGCAGGRDVRHVVRAPAPVEGAIS
jgi:hypothetical protein